MSLLAAIERGWAWKGLHPVEVIDDTPFGNLLVKDRAGQYWRICPEELSCVVVAANADELHALTETEAFRTGWALQALVATARSSCGPLGPGRRYCLKIPATLGGEYKPDNIATISLVELVESAGDMAHQVDGVPDGGAVKLVVR